MQMDHLKTGRRLWPEFLKVLFNPLGLTSFFLLLFTNKNKFDHSAPDNTLNSNMIKGNLEANFSITQKWFYEDHILSILKTQTSY